MQIRLSEKAASGFTLIELSIVLVIIGLIVGGVLIGRDLIHAAELRATISQYDKYNAATNTFRVKYNALPGDIPNPATFGFDQFNPSGPGLGDGDGLILRNTGGAVVVIDGELLLFWRHLSQAKLIEQSLSPDSAPGSSSTAGIDLSQGQIGSNVFGLPDTGKLFPIAKINTAAFMVYGDTQTGLNYFMLLNCGIWPGGLGIGPPMCAPALTPSDSFSIDSKLDDGAPNSGKAIAMATHGNGWGDPNYGFNVTTAADNGDGGTGARDCITAADATGKYNTANGPNNLNCALRLPTE